MYSIKETRSKTPELSTIGIPPGGDLRVFFRLATKWSCLPVRMSGRRGDKACGLGRQEADDRGHVPAVADGRI